MKDIVTDSGIWPFTISLHEQHVKCRKNHDWVINWGGSSFPSEEGVSGDPDIPVANPGENAMTFNEATGACSFVCI